MRDAIEFFGVMFLIIFALVGGAVCLGAGLSYKVCSTAGFTMQRPHQWFFFGGCFIKAKDGDWVPLENFRKFGDES
jgi:hypothetical protein